MCAKEEHIGICYVLKETKVELLDQLCSVKDRRQQMVRERCKELFELLDFLLTKEMPKDGWFHTMNSEVLLSALYWTAHCMR